MPSSSDTYMRDASEMALPPRRYDHDDVTEKEPQVHPEFHLDFDEVYNDLSITFIKIHGVSV